MALLALASLGLGPVPLPPWEVGAALLGQGTEAARVIVQEIRLPRTLLALMIGATLGLAGASLQGLLRNPLADPSLFGAPQAAAFGAVAAISLRWADALSWALPAAAIAGGAVSVGALLLVAGQGAGMLLVVLAGLAVSSLAGAGTALALNLAPNPFAALEIAFWLLGSLQDRSTQHVALAAPFMAAGAALLLSQGPAFRALTLGEEAAGSLGVDVRRARWVVAAGVALGVGAAVAVAGAIGFVGLVVPHLVRPFVRHDPQRLLLPSAAAGAALLLVADMAARSLPASSDIKVGVLTSLVGVPFFLLLIVRERRALGAGAS